MRPRWEANAQRASRARRDCDTARLTAAGSECLVPVQWRGFLRRGFPQMSVTACRDSVGSGSWRGSGWGLGSATDQKATIAGLMYTSPWRPWPVRRMGRPWAEVKASAT